MTLHPNNNNPNKICNRLSVQVSLTGLSFLGRFDAIPTFYIEKKFKHSLTPEGILEELKNLFDTSTDLKLPFSTVSVIYDTTVFTPVPSVMFDADKASENLKFNSKMLANDYVANDSLEALEMNLVYVPFVNINNYFFDRFGSFEYFHSATILLKALTSQEDYREQSIIYIYAAEESFQLIAFEQGKLQLCNSFNYHTPEDFVYYVLFTMEQLKMNPDTVTVVIFGIMTQNDKTFELLYTYIRNLSIMDKKDSEIVLPNATHYNFLLKNSI